MTIGASGLLRAAVEALAQDTPYQVIATPAGFDLRIDVAEARWHGLLAAAGRKKVVEHRVALDETRMIMTMTDVVLEVHWGTGLRDSETGLPRLEAADPIWSKRKGRIYEYESSCTWGGPQGGDSGDELGDEAGDEPGPVVDFIYRSADGQNLIRGAAAELGWRERPGMYQVIAGVCAIVGLAVALVTCGGVAYLAATGRF